MKKTTYKPFRRGMFLYYGDVVRCTPYDEDDIHTAIIVDTLPHRRWMGWDYVTHETYLLDDRTIEDVLRDVE